MDMKQRARSLVHVAVQRGVLPEPHTQPCARCSGEAILYHHHLGYEGALALQVQALCGSCHGFEHVPEKAYRRRVQMPQLTSVRGLRLLGLRRCRLERELSVYALTELSGISKEAISTIEQVHTGAPPETVERLAAALEVEPAVLYGEDPPSRFCEHSKGQAYRPPLVLLERARQAREAQAESLQAQRTAT